MRIPKTKEQWALAIQGLVLGMSLAVNYFAFPAVVSFENYHYANVTGVCSHLDPRESAEAATAHEHCLWANRLKSVPEAFLDGITIAQHRNLDDKHINELNTKHLQRRGTGGVQNDSNAASSPEK